MPIYFPNKVWEGWSSTRLNPATDYSPPTPEDWAQLLKEHAAAQAEILSLKMQVFTLSVLALGARFEDALILNQRVAIG